ncbi:hypothetical protein BJ170DRAFT_484362 [Xylariales sp. AK1849]|nr:hypothetical protein BJ170DRAFT_484362 [Xylariales sp. AK1849]
MNATGWRQQPGFACEECRRRKARCNRQQPRCGSCIESGVACITATQRPQRGPKKGQLDMMRSRIAMLEWELEKQKEPNAESSTVIDISVPTVAMPRPSITGTGPKQGSYTDINMIPDNFMAHMTDSTQPYFNWPTTPPNSETASAYAFGSSEGLNRDYCLSSPGITFEEHSDPGKVTPATSFGDPEISDLVLADLDDVYFDRAQNICPMVHQRRYFAWMNQSDTSPARECLRSAMRTLAAAMSAPYCSLANVLYSRTRRLLEEFKQAGNRKTTWSTSQDFVLLEYIQSWLLLAHYESLQMNESQAMLTAGHAFRLIQMARLHEIDAPERTVPHGNIHSEPNDDFAATEERRRTFWVAYNLDCFLSWRSEGPLTLYEDMVSTRLPAPEANFQNSQPVSTDSLPEAMSKDASMMLSPFAECVVLVTLHSRCMVHRRASSKESGKEPRGFWCRHEWLASAVDKRIELLAQTPPTTIIERDAMLFFTHMLAYSAIICLGGTVQRMPWQAAEHQLMGPAYEQCVSRATAEIVRLAKTLPSLSCFKVHPFLPNLLASAVTFLFTQSPTDDSQTGAGILLRLLRDLRDVNSLALKIYSTYDGVRHPSLLEHN